MNEINPDLEQQALDLKDIAAEANGLIGGLKKIKADVKNKLGDIEVTYNPISKPEVAKAMVEVFGKEYDSKTEPGMKAISFETYIACLNIVKLAGKAKADELLKDKIFT